MDINKTYLKLLISWFYTESRAYSFYVEHEA